MGGRHTLVVLALLGFVLALAPPSSLAKLPKPVPRDDAIRGEYHGQIRSQGFPTPSRPALSFVYRGSEVARFAGTVPMSCGHKELSEGPELFDHALGPELHGAVTAKGIFKATEYAEVATAETATGTARVRVTLQGWFDGDQVRGGYRVISTDGSGCSGGGVWDATRVVG